MEPEQAGKVGRSPMVWQKAYGGKRRMVGNGSTAPPPHTQNLKAVFCLSKAPEKPLCLVHTSLIKNN